MNYLSLKIEDNIAIPPRTGLGRTINPNGLYCLLGKLLVGQSVLIPCSELQPSVLRPRIFAAIRRLRAENGDHLAFATLLVKEGKSAGIRVWRKEDETPKAVTLKPVKKLVAKAKARRKAT